MFYRVTQSQMAANAQVYLTKQSSELSVAQQQVSSGLRIQRPSDDPAGMRRSLIQKDRIERLATHEESIQAVKSRLNEAAVQLQDTNDLLTRARTIALQAPQTTDSSERKILAQQLTGLIEQLDSIANASDENGFLFSGTAANTQPFLNVQSTAGQQQYSGASATTQLHITGDVSRQALLPGDAIFQPVSREPSVIVGSTGAKIGTGTDSATGQRELLVSHTLTTYAAGSGVSAGSDSVNGDTIIGPAARHQLVINDTSGTGASGTVSLNGGPPIAFTNADTNLEVIGSKGERVYLNTTGISAGFVGAVDITSEGTLSIDDGATQAAITYGSNQIVTDSRDGTTVNLDTTSIIKAGTDHLEFPGTADMFNILKTLRDDVLNTRNLEPSALAKSLNRRLADVERVQEHLLDIVGVQSVSLEQIDRLETRTGDLKVAGQVQYSETTSADLTAAILRFQELTNLQQYTLSAIGKLMNTDLLTYLQ